MSYDEPDAEHSALITIDVQCDTLDGQPLAIPGTSAVVPAIGRLARHFRETGRPILHVVRLYRQDGSNAELCRKAALEAGRSILIAGSPGSQLAPGILASPDLRLDAERLLRGERQQAGPLEWLLYKPRWGAFFGTALERVLRELGVSSLVVTGCNFPNCPRATLYEASERDFRLIAIADGISGIYERGIGEIEGIGARVMTEEAFLAWDDEARKRRAAAPRAPLRAGGPS